MLKLIVLFVCVYVCLSAPASDEPIPIISKEIVVEHDGKFHFNYESGDGTKVHESGSVKALDKDTSAEAVEGAYEYSAPDGQKVSVQYIADENGFQPQGDVLPVAPPVPEAIARALKYLAEHPAHT